jgi:hypothetical protein
VSGADALHVRHVRRAIYGPPITAAAGIAFLAAGLVGLAVHGRTHHQATPTVAPAPTSVPEDMHRPYALVTADGDVVGAAATPGGGYWTATRDGHIMGVGVASLGEHVLPAGSPPVVGIAAAPGGGYWVARADGHVDAFGARSHGDLGTWPHAPVTGIAASSHGGYWLATSDGHVFGFGDARDHGMVLGGSRSPVVGIAPSTKTDGYYLATQDGHVFFFGAPNHGETARFGVNNNVAAIAPSSTGGYWITTTDGHVYAFGTPADSPSSDIGRVVAIVPR